MSYVRAIRAALPSLREGGGAVVNLSSSAGKRPSTSMPHYSVTKAAVLSLSRLVADLYASDGIRCNAVTPGPTETDIWLGDGGLAEQQGRSRRGAGEGRRRTAARAARPAGGDRRGGRVPLLRARVLRDRRGLERRRRNRPDHPLMRDGPRVIGGTLLAALAASQAALVVLNPLLPDVARDLDVSIATAGQLRTVSGFAAGLAALLVGLLATRVGLRGLLLGAIVVLAVRLAAERRRARLRGAGAGPGGHGCRDRRLVLGRDRGDGRVGEAGRAIARARDRAARSAARLDRRDAARRARGRGELAARVARRPACRWPSSRVALLLRRPATPPAPARAGPAIRVHASGRRALVVGRAARLLGLGRRARLRRSAARGVVRPLDRGDRARTRVRGARLRAGEPPLSPLGRRRTTAGCSSHSRCRPPWRSTVLYAVRPSVWFSVAAFAALSFIAGGRTLAGSARGLGLAPELRLGVTGVRTAALQSGYFVGAAVGGVSARRRRLRDARARVRRAVRRRRRPARLPTATEAPVRLYPDAWTSSGPTPRVRRADPRARGERCRRSPSARSRRAVASCPRRRAACARRSSATATASSTRSRSAG